MVNKLFLGLGAYAAVTLIGGVNGFNFTKNDEYRVTKEEGTKYIESKETGERHELRIIDGEVYLGDMVHNLNGVRHVGIYEGKKSMNPRIDDLNSRIETLAGRIEKRTKIDRLEMLVQGIIYKMTESKYNILNGTSEKKAKEELQALSDSLDTYKFE